MPILRSLLGLLMLSTVGCGAGRPVSAPRTTGAPVAPAPEPGFAERLAAMRERESTVPLRDYRVRAADGAIELHVNGSAPPRPQHRKRADGSAFSMVEIPIGGEVDLSCQVSAEPIDLGHWMEAIMQELHATLLEPPTVALEVVEGHPLLLVHTEAIVEIAGVKKRHIAKFALAHLDQGSVACVHDEVGYEETFRGVARRIVSASRTPEAERPSYRAIALESDGERVLGFEEVRSYRGKGPGESRQMSLSSAILVREGGWTTGDSGWSGIVDKQGVLHERAVRRVGASVVVDMTLDRKAPGAFAFDGTVDGKPKKGAFRAREPLVTRLSRASALAAFTRDERKKEIAFLHFDEHLPEAPLREVFEREGKQQLRLTDNGKSYHCTVDPQGVCAGFWKDGAAWKTKRVFSSGSP